MSTTSLGTLISTERRWSEWIMIPGLNGNPFKTESRRAGLPDQVAVADDGQSVQVVEEKTTNWHSDDPRFHEPHTHPWPFVSKILAGRIREKRWVRQKCSGDFVYRGVFTWEAGQTYYCGTNVAHSVFDVAPGTKTHMFIGVAPNGPKDWGHLRLSLNGLEGIYVPNQVDPDFLARFKHLNSRPE